MVIEKGAEEKEHENMREKGEGGYKSNEAKKGLNRISNNHNAIKMKTKKKNPNKNPSLIYMCKSTKVGFKKSRSPQESCKQL